MNTAYVEHIRDEAYKKMMAAQELGDERRGLYRLIGNLADALLQTSPEGVASQASAKER